MSVDEIARESIIILNNDGVITRITSQTPDSHNSLSLEVDDISTVGKLRSTPLDANPVDADSLIQKLPTHHEIARKGCFAIYSEENKQIGLLLYQTSKNGPAKAGLITSFQTENATQSGECLPILYLEDVFINGEYTHSYRNFQLPLFPVIHQANPEHQLTHEHLVQAANIFMEKAFPEGHISTEFTILGYTLPKAIKTALKNAGNYASQIKLLVGKHL